MRALCLAVGLLVSCGTVQSDMQGWWVKVGLGGNKEPYGLDTDPRIAVYRGSYWDYDAYDAAHPPCLDRRHDLMFSFSEQYPRVYREEVPHDSGPFHWQHPIGWPPPWEPGRGTPDYPRDGLLKDSRAPILAPRQPEFWLVDAYAPIGGSTCTLMWTIPEEFPLGRIEVVLWGNQDLESAGVCGDLVLTDYRYRSHELPGISQWGWDLQHNVPIVHNWVIQATLVPEPGVGQVAGLLVGVGALGVRRLRRR
jgi:hypothetical protein